MTPDEVRSVTFEKGVRGYHCGDVDEFLQQIALSLETALQERDDALAEVEASKQKLLVLAQKIEEYRSEEDTLKTAMINAQRMGENVIREAKQKAESILREANIKAEDREQHSLDEIKEQEEKLETMQTEVTRFKNEVLDLYKKHIELLSALPGEEAPEQPAELPSETEEFAPEQTEAAALGEPAEEPAYIPLRSEQAEPLSEPQSAAEPAGEIAFAAPIDSQTENFDAQQNTAESTEPEQEEPGEIAFAIPLTGETPLQNEEKQENPKPLTFDSFRGISFDD